MNSEERSWPESRPAPLVVFSHVPLPPSIITRVYGTHDGGFYGLYDSHLLASQAAAFIGANSDANQELLTQVIYTFLAQAREDSVVTASAMGDSSDQVAHSCWFSIRMSLSTDEWVVPRWHTDGRMFYCTCPEPKAPHSKYGFTILGPSTRVMETNPAVNGVLNEMSLTGRPYDQNSPDPELAKRLKEYEETTVKLGQAIRFSWGQRDSPVHSEPDSRDSHRVFITVLAGSEGEIRDMCDFRGEKYGSWCY